MDWLADPQAWIAFLTLTALELVLGELACPPVHPIGAIEFHRRYFGHVDELLEKPLVIAPCPSAHDGSYLHVLPCKRFEARAG